MTTQTFGRIAWIGTGKIGLPMAARIAAAGYDIVAYDVSEQRVTEARKRKLVTAGFVADAVKGAKVVFTSLPDDTVLLTAVAGTGGLLAVMPADAILVETSTVSPEASARVAEAAAVGGAVEAERSRRVGGPSRKVPTYESETGVGQGADSSVACLRWSSRGSVISPP